MDISPNTQALPPGTRLEEFLIERVLGAGGFGITYLATDTALGRQVVIKENLPVQFAWRDPNSFTVAPRHSHGEDADNFAWSLENFSRESAMLASLDHPGIVKVHRSFLAHGTAFFVMPYVEGMPLDELVKQRGSASFSEDELRGMLQRVLGALGYLHDRGIYHRDLKPGNILITSSGEPVLIDFGSARQKLSERSMTIMASPGYTPFEQLHSRGNVGPWSDLYAVAGTVAKVINGETPPDANERAFDDPWVPLAKRTELSAQYSISFLTSVDRAFAARPGDRWQDAGEWLDALAGTRYEPQQASVPPQLDPTPRSAICIPSISSGEIGDEMRFPIRGSDEVVVKYVPGGRFQMGSPLDEEGRKDDEDQIWVSLSSHYWMAEAAVTQGQWMAVMGSNPSKFTGEDRLPVENVSWNDTQEFIKKLNSESPPGAGWKWALPTEAQWERACRGGTTTATAFGDSLSSRQANFNGSHPYGGAAKGPNLEKTTVSKNYQPNAYGLYDMHGNVWEWCEDAYQDKLPGGGDPLVSLGKYHVGRGGGWIDCGAGCRSADRDWGSPVLRPLNLGFRLAAVLAGQEEEVPSGVILVPEEAPVPPQRHSSLRSVSPASPLTSGEIGDEVKFPISNGEEVVVRYVPGGRFQMGSPLDEEDRSDDEEQVWVTLSSHCWMAETSVTQGQWVALMGSNPSHFKGGDWKKLPVENVSWNDAQSFITKLNTKSPPCVGWKWVLPTEAQWERACRGGTTTATAFGDSLSSTQANFNGNYPYGKASSSSAETAVVAFFGQLAKLFYSVKGPYLQKTSAVRRYEPNAYGLYDMHGNVSEWCADTYQNKLLGGENPLSLEGPDRVYRGGSWGANGWSCRSAYRHDRPVPEYIRGFWEDIGLQHDSQRNPNFRYQHLGFRVALVRAEL